VVGAAVGAGGSGVTTRSGVGEGGALGCGASVGVALGVGTGVGGGVGVGVGSGVGEGVGGTGVGVGSGGVGVCGMVGTIAGYGVVLLGVGDGEGDGVTSGVAEGDALTLTPPKPSRWRCSIAKAAPMRKPRRTTATKTGKSGKPRSELLRCVRRRRPPGVRDLTIFAFVQK